MSNENIIKPFSPCEIYKCLLSSAIVKRGSFVNEAPLQWTHELAWKDPYTLLTTSSTPKANISGCFFNFDLLKCDTYWDDENNDYM